MHALDEVKPSAESQFGATIVTSVRRDMLRIGHRGNAKYEPPYCTIFREPRAVQLRRVDPERLLRYESRFQRVG
jgi:hypothetical protein